VIIQDNYEVYTGSSRASIIWFSVSRTLVGLNVDLLFLDFGSWLHMSIKYEKTRRDAPRWNVPNCDRTLRGIIRLRYRCSFTLLVLALELDGKF